MPLINFNCCEFFQNYKFLPMPMFTMPSTLSMTSTLCCDPEVEIFPRIERRRQSYSRTQLQAARGTLAKLEGSSLVLPCDNIHLKIELFNPPTYFGLHTPDRMRVKICICLNPVKRIFNPNCDLLGYI